MRDTIPTFRSHANAKFNELLVLYESLKRLFDTSVSTTKTAFERIDELQSVMRGGDVLIRPDRRTAEELQRRAKILFTGSTRLEGEDSPS